MNSTSISSALASSSVGEGLDGVLEAAGAVAFYLVVWGLVFAGTALFVGAFVPFVTGDSLLFAAGILTAGSEVLDIRILAIGVAIAAFAGDQVGFWLGRRLGRPYLDSRGGPRVQRAVARTERFYTLFGWWSVVIARYVPWARVFIPVIAGVGRMPALRFASANLVGALSWGVAITVLGYFAATSPQVRPIAYGIAAAAILASVIAGVRAWRRDRAARVAAAGAAAS
ncbi:DedA family protein [Naasia sp. SYSU D00057]|uniref:DedA family protein n=1 Tax=Naasia sp. SYSU D00057 TaxID=2817380 RepID=UPI0027DCBA3C|nr:DedA family protein [Naasia sp. SYSU D00057]